MAVIPCSESHILIFVQNWTNGSGPNSLLCQELQRVKSFTSLVFKLVILSCLVNFILKYRGEESHRSLLWWSLYSILPVSAIVFLVTAARACFAPTEDLHHQREETFTLPSKICSAPCFHLDSPSKSKRHQRFPSVWWKVPSLFQSETIASLYSGICAQNAPLCLANGLRTFLL